MAFQNLQRPPRFSHLLLPLSSIPKPRCRLMPPNLYTTAMAILINYLNHFMAGQATYSILPHTATICNPLTIIEYLSGIL